MHANIIPNVDSSFIEDYIKSRGLTKEKSCKLIGFSMGTLHKLLENKIPLRFFAFYKFSALLSINPEDVITDEDVLAQYKQYAIEYRNEINLGEGFTDYINKRKDIMSQEFEEMLNYE